MVTVWGDETTTTNNNQQETVMETKTITTKDIIRTMMITNTGKHFLDSGGDNGRMWQRNQVKDKLLESTNKSWDDTPAVSIDGRWGIEVTISLYHFLNHYLTYEPDITEKLLRYIEEHDYYDMEGMEEFAKDYEAGTAKSWLGGDIQAGNTYNDASLLSQVFQYVDWVEPNTEQAFIAIQIHNGADVRGGYTRPVVFSYKEWDVYDFFSWPYAYISCDNCDAQWYTDDAYNWYTDSADVLLHELEGVEVDSFFDELPEICDRYLKDGTKWYLYDHDTGEVRCPCCSKGTLHASAQCGF